MTRATNLLVLGLAPLVACQTAGPVVQVPAAPSQDHLPATAPTFVEAVRDGDGCAVLEGDRDIPLIKARLAPGLILWGAPCRSGAYSFHYSLFTTNEQGGDRRNLTFRYVAAGMDSRIVWDAQYDPRTMVLSGLRRGRGLGDCGVFTRWAWNGRAFALVYDSQSDDCGAEKQPDQWPVLYQAIVKQASQ